MAAPETPEHNTGSRTPAGMREDAGPASLPVRQELKRTLLGKIVAVVAIAFGGLYLLNPSAGAIELLPDVLPVVGNLDEAGATALLLWGLGYFGIDLVRARRSNNEE